MGIHRNYVNKKTHSSFCGYKFWIMGIHRNYVNKKTHSSFFIYSYKFWNIDIQRNIFFYVYPYLIICNYKKGTMHIFIHVVPFYSYKLLNMGIQRNKNSFFTWDFKIVSKNSISHYLHDKSFLIHRKTLFTHWRARRDLPSFSRQLFVCFSFRNLHFVRIKFR